LLVYWWWCDGDGVVVMWCCGCSDVAMPPTSTSMPVGRCCGRNPDVYRFSTMRWCTVSYSPQSLYCICYGLVAMCLWVVAG
jgi:hypothetical protein